MVILLSLSAVAFAVVLYIKKPANLRKPQRRMERRQHLEMFHRNRSIYNRLFGRLKYKRLTHIESDRED